MLRSTTVDMLPACEPTIVAELPGWGWRSDDRVPGAIDILAASPDCTAWSQLRNLARQNTSAANITDEFCIRHRLRQTDVLLDLCDMVIEKMPRIFWFENPSSNVSGIWGGMVKALGDAQYKVNYCKYSANDDVFKYAKVSLAMQLCAC